MKRRAALEEFAIPKTQTQVRSFVGMCNVYQRFVKHFAKIVQPLNELVKKGTPKDLTAPMEQRIDAFHTLKEALLNSPILCLPQPGKPYTVDVDASAHHVECTLLQEQADGKLLPVGYWSRTLNKAERNYSTTEREFLSVV